MMREGARMSLRITFDIFSGVPNPEIVLDDADAKVFLDQLGLAKMTPVAATHPGIESTLGYRGLIVEQVGVPRSGLQERFRIAGSNVVSSAATFRLPGAAAESMLLAKGVKGRAAGISEELAALILAEAATSSAKTSAQGAKASSPEPVQLLKCPCAPIYEPAWWNDAATGGTRQLHNNCYNYACNYRTDTYAQPGRAGGASITAMTCAGIRPVVVSDALAAYTPDSNVGLKCPGKGCMVAMVVWPNWDFHWYRLGADGFWTHKPGSNPVTNLDNNGHVITDPRTADRGRYTAFCSFFIVMNGHIKIK
jgi:hypothetical protein